MEDGNIDVMDFLDTLITCENEPRLEQQSSAEIGPDLASDILSLLDSVGAQQPDPNAPSQVLDLNQASTSLDAFSNEVPTTSQFSPLHFELDPLPAPGCDLSPVPASDACPVCGNAAGRHSYYGGRSCVSCRAFFRRTVQSQAHLQVACKSHGRCTIDSRSWRSCKACRFRKCLRAGMRPEYVLNEEQRRVRNLRRRPDKSVVKGQVTVVAPRSPNEVFSEEDFALIQTLTKDTYDIVLSSIRKFVTNRKDFYDHLVDVLCSAKPMDMVVYKSSENFTTYNAKTLFQKNPDMRQFSARDQSDLVAKNFPICLGLIRGIMVDAPVDDKNLMTQMVDLLQEVSKRRWLQPDWDSSTVAKLQKARERSVTYEQIHPSDWIQDQEISRRYRKLFMKIREWPTDESDRQIDETQMMLMFLVMLFSPDSIELDDPKAAHSVQTKYAAMLYRYLKTKYRRREGEESQALAKFGQGMMVSSMSREMMEIQEQHWKQPK